MFPAGRCIVLRNAGPFSSRAVRSIRRCSSTDAEHILSVLYKSYIQQHELERPWGQRRCVCVFMHADLCVLCLSHWWVCLHVYVMFLTCFPACCFILQEVWASHSSLSLCAFPLCPSVIYIPEWEPVFCDFNTKYPRN